MTVRRHSQESPGCVNRGLDTLWSTGKQRSCSHGKSQEAAAHLPWTEGLFFFFGKPDSKSIQSQATKQSHLKEQLTCVLPSHDPHQDVAKKNKQKKTTKKNNGLVKYSHYNPFLSTLSFPSDHMTLRRKAPQWQLPFSDWKRGQLGMSEFSRHHIRFILESSGEIIAAGSPQNWNNT